MDISEYTTVGDIAAAVGRDVRTVAYHVRHGHLAGAVTVGTGRHAVHLVPRRFLDPAEYAAAAGRPGRRRAE